MASRNRALASANNLANLNTPGYRAQEANTATGPQGRGAAVDSISFNTLEGSLISTGNPTDLAIQGPGYFTVADGNGNPSYTRDGSFRLSANGTLVNSQGLTLQPPIAIPRDATAVNIGSDGAVHVQLPGGRTANVGQVQLAHFSNPQGLIRTGGNLLAPTGASGVAQTGAPGTGGLGVLQSGFLESSNVDIAQEMIQLRLEENITRANVAVARTGDEMTRTAIDLLG